MLYFFVFSYQEVCQCVYVYACVGVGGGWVKGEYRSKHKFNASYG